MHTADQKPILVESTAAGATTATSSKTKHVTFPDYFSSRQHPHDVELEPRTSNANVDGVKIFDEPVMFPKGWSQNAVDITSGKYFRYVEQEDGSLKRETSILEMVTRVVDTITEWGVHFGYFRNRYDAGVFGKELAYVLLTQRASFNSPVWFNIGTKRGRIGQEQASACFINSVDDDMASILDIGKIEGSLYKQGSGSGVNYSALRSSVEKLSGGGTASGPVPFVQKDDSNGGAIKSGGTTRRAAKMAILNADHGDIEEFIGCKALAEKMAQALIDAGFNGDFTARYGVYQMLPFQNANHSVRVTDSFMKAVERDGDWNLMARDGQTVLKTVKARHLWDLICDAAWVCGDPGLQFDTTINDMHTCPADGRINSSNPCSEYMHLDDSACNLASLNLRKFQKEDGALDEVPFRHTVDVMITAQDILVEGAGYPTDKIGKNARKYRQLGLGYANLGAFLMYLGLPYDSDEGRLVAGLVTAALCGRAYRQSAVLAEAMGPFAGYARNASFMLDVIKTHGENIDKLVDRYHPSVNQYVTNLYHIAEADWSSAYERGQQHGFRNAQGTVMAPTGTIAFMMDCDTTGVEPDTALVKSKKLVGGGTMKIVNEGVYAALARLGYNEAQCDVLIAYMRDKGSFVGSALKPEHLPVFDTAFPEPVGKRALSPEAHVLMLAAIQPFVSGAISKTCNMPNEATREEIGKLYMLAWKEGLKAIALYRDGCKRSQPLSNAKATAEPAVAETFTKKLVEQEQVIQALKEQIADLQEKTQAHRRKLPDDRQSITHKFRIAQDFKGYLICGMYPDGSLGEIFINGAKEGSKMSGLLDSIATLTSFALQHGVPLQSLSQKFKGVSFEPYGWTGNPEINYAASVVDYVFRFLELRFLNKAPIEVVEPLVEKTIQPLGTNGNGHHGYLLTDKVEKSDRTCPACQVDGMVRTGSCWTCPSCGHNGGCG